MASATTTASVSPSTPNRRTLLAGDDAPWRAASAPVPRVHHAPVLRVAIQDDPAAYALAVMKHPNPVGRGWRWRRWRRPPGRSVVPGQQPLLQLLGLKVWPTDVELRFLEPFGRELHSMRKFMDRSCSVMNPSLPNKVAHG